MIDRRALWNRLRWQLRPAGLAALAVIVLALLYAVLVLPALGERLAAQRTELAALTQRGRAGPVGGTSREDTANRLQDFYALLPRTASTAAWLRKFDAAAGESGLTLQSGEYRIERRPDHRVLQYRITLPVSGSYANVRSFIDAVLTSVPSASLDDVQLTRESTQAHGVNARLRFSLYLLADPS